jgi:hypothetical protein
MPLIQSLAIIFKSYFVTTLVAASILLFWGLFSDYNIPFTLAESDINSSTTAAITKLIIRHAIELGTFFIGALIVTGFYSAIVGVFVIAFSFPFHRLFLKYKLYKAWHCLAPSVLMSFLFCTFLVVGLMRSEVYSYEFFYSQTICFAIVLVYSLIIRHYTLKALAD